MGWLPQRLLWWRGRVRPRASLRRRIVRQVVTLPFALVLLSILITLGLRWIDPPTTAFMLRDQRTARSEGRTGYRLRHYWVEWKHVAPAARIAVVAAEDQRFPYHSGFDLESIAEAVQQRVRTGRVRGASTISQQVAKNLFLWPEQSFVRKGVEAYFTTLIEFFWSKQRILEVYLNVAQFGEGVFGIEAASIQFFCKSASELTSREAATLAAVLPNPVHLLVDRPSAYVESRSRWILSQVAMLGGNRHLRDLSDR